MDKWDKDIQTSVEMYNDWYLTEAPKLFNQGKTTSESLVHALFAESNNLTDISDIIIKEHLPALRMCCDPPLAVDRLSGLANITKSSAIRPRDADINAIRQIIIPLINTSINWEVVADRVTMAVVVRNAFVQAQEQRQLDKMRRWLTNNGYLEGNEGDKHFKFRYNVAAKDQVKLPIDIAIWRPKLLCVEAKSAGDYTNTNKRKKEDVERANRLLTYRPDSSYVMLLCGYFDKKYLEFMRSNKIPCVWEHRLDDLHYHL